jgi:CRP/FNR family transcriptional regulator, cyclic AMP receptor protein
LPGMGDGAPWLDALQAGDWEALRELGAERRYGAGVVLFHYGDEPGSVLLLLEGRVKFVLPGPQGKEIILGFAGPGELVGDVAAIDGEPRSASAETVDAVRALVVPRAAFERFVETHPTAAMLLVRTLARRLRLSDEQRLEFAAYDVVGRVARRLVELCDRHGEPAADGVLITLPLSQDELAAWSASSREAVAKALHLLRELGWIETHRRRILVRDLEALRKYAG